MKTIEERAIQASEGYDDQAYSAGLYMGYKEGAKEQKAIDRADYKQGYNDAIKTACNVFCYTGCPHKTDNYNCLNDKCDTWKIFRKMMENSYENNRRKSKRIF